MYSTETNSNTRIKSLDLARGFTVLMIAPVHTVLLYSDPAIYGSMLVKLLSLIAEGPGAQLFMLLMGIYFSFQKQSSAVRILKRVLILLLIAYGLNLVKFVLPLSLYLLPEKLLADLQVQNNPQGAVQLLLIGDILQFAAIALVILFFVKRIKHYEYVSMFFAVVIIFLSPYCWDIHSNNAFINYSISLAGGQPPQVFFPVFPWVVYPLLGLSAGYFLKTYGHQVFAWMRNFGFIFLGYGWVLKSFFFKIDSPSFYRTYPADTCIHIGIVFITLYVWEWLQVHVTDNYFFRLLTYMSQHITQVYLIQWVLIFWLLPFFGYQQLDYTNTLLAIAATSFITIALSFLLTLTNREQQQNP